MVSRGDLYHNSFGDGKAVSDPRRRNVQSGPKYTRLQGFVII